MIFLVWLLVILQGPLYSECVSIQNTIGGQGVVYHHNVTYLVQPTPSPTIAYDNIRQTNLACDLPTPTP